MRMGKKYPSGNAGTRVGSVVHARRGWRRVWTMLSISGLCMVVEAAELLDSWGLGVVKDWLSRRVGAVARGCAGEGGREQLFWAVVWWRRCGDVVLERFRQLERAKEMRQQRELLKLFSEADHVQSAMAFESSKLLHSELTLPPRQPIQASLSFQPTMQTEHNDLLVNTTPVVANLCSTDSVMNLTYNFDESDVDTSLHL
ncbi:hypothetical protein H0E87_000730 [Populus deltoides]|uniref:Uncharacterized protein n=1 Tax=Populus deltoides TaxID=3696 RepID=A0A8T2ZNW1_POPDE|nr:hypothetical protein H0E87_000730 [Populus deltoides]